MRASDACVQVEEHLYATKPNVPPVYPSNRAEFNASAPRPGTRLAVAPARPSFPHVPLFEVNGSKTMFLPLTWPPTGLLEYVNRTASDVNILTTRNPDVRKDITLASDEQRK